MVTVSNGFTLVPALASTTPSSVFMSLDKYIGRAKKQSADGKLQLEVISSQVIPKNEIFVSTPHKDSLDSRYAKVGTINKQYILGKAYEIF
ncbi:S26 family signal peptidase [Acinetobacter baumannii]|uniref:S26 family signal peptidase n=1 Tax=Acinetobacter baumannii TaxID=470 RepID=UPI001D0E7B82|nr:S26 family signal peptidase [Acinetobacter baumannii]